MSCDASLNFQCTHGMALQNALNFNDPSPKILGYSVTPVGRSEIMRPAPWRNGQRSWPRKLPGRTCQIITWGSAERVPKPVILLAQLSPPRRVRPDHNLFYREATIRCRQSLHQSHCSFKLDSYPREDQLFPKLIS